jgi:hypothetical protein
MATSLSEPRNRLGQVIDSKAVNGISFIELKTVDAKTLYVHFLNSVDVAPKAPLKMLATIAGGERITGIKANAIDATTDWSTDSNGNRILAVRVKTAGDFSTYTLTLTTDKPLAGGPSGSFVPLEKLDPMYTSANFSFKVLCPSEFDCAPQCGCCPDDEPPLPAIDYTAKDFQSFKLALSNFSSQRYPSWQERSEADFGVMFMEALCQLGDELSYLQDRVATEAQLLTATQQRSLVNLARLVDYEPSPAFSASTQVQCNVTGSSVPAGILVTATTPDGVTVPFEIGTGLNDSTDYATNPMWNSGIPPYWFDDSQKTLSCGATQMYLYGHGFEFEAAINAFAVATQPLPVQLLIQTDLPGQSLLQVVTLIAATELEDPIFLSKNKKPTKVTLIQWGASDALTDARDLTATTVAGNLLPATQGQRFSENFAIATPPAGAQGMLIAVARYGPNGSDASPNWIFRYPLSSANAANCRLAWLPSQLAGDSAVDPDTAEPQPEIILNRVLPEPESFAFSTSLLDATAGEAAYTVDPQAWRIVARDATGTPSHWEYDGDQGDTIRFGNGAFGAQPADGEVYKVEYRIGLGAAGNVAANAIQNIGANAASYITAVSNPFDVTTGADAETAQHIQRMAPQAFRAQQYRAVTAADYQAAAEQESWVLSAGCSFRWTGSWLTVFTVADPTQNAANDPADAETNQIDLINLLNRRRLAGYESYAPPPWLVSVDLVITVCVQQGWLSSDVEAGVLTALADAQNPNGKAGFFYADSFTFGTPLYRANLEAAIQAVPGVNGVLDIEYRQRGATTAYLPLPDMLQIGAGQILRVANDPNYPERGIIRVIAEGGR